MLRVVSVVVVGAVFLAGCTSSGATSGQKNVDALTKAINRLGDSIKKGKS